MDVIPTDTRLINLAFYLKSCLVYSVGALLENGSQINGGQSDDLGGFRPNFRDRKIS